MTNAKTGKKKDKRFGLKVLKEAEKAGAPDLMSYCLTAYKGQAGRAYRCALDAKTK